MYKFFQYLKIIILANRFLYLLFRFGIKHQHLLVNKETQIVIEGFPRSANTLAYVALKDVQIDLKIAHHFHYPIQIINGVRRKIPVVVLIREPKDAIISTLIREPHISIEIAVKRYISFYQIALKYKDYIVLVDFELVVSDFNQVIKLINKKFNLELNQFDSSQENIKKCKALVLEMDMIDRNSEQVNLSTVSLPNKYKEIRKRKIISNINNEEVFHSAILLYNKLTK